MSKKLNIIFLIIILFILIFGLIIWQKSSIGEEEEFYSDLIIIQQNSLVAFSSPSLFKRKIVIVTAYSSTLDQTDSTPFITASGTRTRDGVIACNFLSPGTEVIFPDLFGDKIFVVEDRMHPRNWYKMDIWFPTRQQALEFGAKWTEVIIL